MDGKKKERKKEEGLKQCCAWVERRGFRQLRWWTTATTLSTRTHTTTQLCPSICECACVCVCVGW